MRRDQLIDEWFTILQSLQRAWKGQYYQGLGSEELTIGQLGLMFYLQEKQPVSSKQIAADMMTGKSAVAQLVDALDRRQLIMRHHDPTDRRITYLALSRAGMDKIQALHTKRKEFYLRVAGALDDHEIATMTSIQRKLVDHLAHGCDTGTATLSLMDQDKQGGDV